tara:strand:- start:205 stop:1707 length:1503 start_codon:yes stop_codon:yes gene_type:complete
MVAANFDNLTDQQLIFRINDLTNISGEQNLSAEELSRLAALQAEQARRAGGGTTTTTTTTGDADTDDPGGPAPVPVDFSDLSPQEQILGELLGTGRGLSAYLFDPDRDPFIPPEAYVPTLDDAPGVQEAIAAARSGLGAYQDYFSRGRDLLDMAAGRAGEAGRLAREGIAGATGRTDQAIAQAQAAQALAQAQAAQGGIAADTAIGREQALSDQAIANALATQQAIGDLAGPGGVAAFMDPYQEAVIDSTLRRLDEQGAMAQDRANAAAVRAGAFGGSRSGIQSALLADRLQQTKADTLNQLTSQNFLQAQRAAQNAAQLQASGGQLGQQAFSTATGRALGSGQLGLGLGQLGARTALQGGQLATQAGLQGARTDLAGGQLRAQTAIGANRAIGALGQGIGQLGAQSALTAQRGIQQAGQLGAIPLDIAQRAAEAQRGTAIEQEYFPIRDFGIVGDFFRGVPTSQSVPFQQASTGQTNPFLGALGGGITGLQVGQLFGNR